MEFVIIFIILIIIICIVCILIKNSQINDGYQQFTGEQTTELEDSRFLDEQHYLKWKVYLIKNFVQNIKTF